MKFTFWIGALPKSKEVKILFPALFQRIQSHRDLKLTPTGEAYGTPLYMSPEIATGDPNLNERSDVFALGLLLFEILTLRAFVEGDDIIEIKQKILEKPYPLPLEVAPNRRIPLDLQAICMKALQRKKAKRYPSVPHFLENTEFRHGE